MFFKAFKGEILVLPSRTIALLFCVILFFIPLSVNPFTLFVLTFANTFVIFAVSWDLLSGYTGQVDFGHAAFFGIAAYTAALLNLHLGLSPLFTIPIGAVIAVLVGLLIGVPCLRLRGPYLALATLAFPIILSGILFIEKPFCIVCWSGGEFGLRLSPLSSSRVYNYYFSLLMMLGASLVMWKITDSKIGIILHAIREDEIAARTCGINTTSYKLVAFSISGFFAGIAGGFYAHLLRVANYNMLGVFMSFQPIIWTVFGGITTIYGAIGGTYLLYSLPEIMYFVEMRYLLFIVLVVVLAIRGTYLIYSRSRRVILAEVKYYLLVIAVFVVLTISGVFSGLLLEDVKYLFIAGATVLVMLFMPEGIFNWIRDKIEKECPRCKKRNIATRELCRVCDAELD